MKKKVNRSARTIDKERSSIHLNAEKVASYEEAFALIQKATNISDIEQLVGVFLSAEDENFRLFNFVNQLNGEIEKEEDGIERLRQQVDAMKGGEEESVEGVRKQLLGSLAAELTATTSQRVANEQAAKQAESMLASLMEGVEAVFDMLGCDRARARERVGSEAVTESTVGEWLGLVEERVNELCGMYQQQLGEQSEEQAVQKQADEQQYIESASDATDSKTALQSSASDEPSTEEGNETSETTNTESEAAEQTSEQTTAEIQSGAEQAEAAGSVEPEATSD